jgi:N-acetylglucosaminyl-diphospho-decaprenol L-rhamnosyltransferase
MNSAGKPNVSITVVAYNSDHCLRECLLSIRRTVLKGYSEVVVVDNASPDQSAHIVVEDFPEAKLLRSEMNRGYAGGCNLAWPLVRGRYWLLLNPDVVVPASGLERLVDWMDRHPELGAGSPELMDPAGHVISAARRFPSLTGSILEMLRLHLLMSPRRRAELLLGGYWRAGEEHLNVDWVPGTAMIVRREAVEAAGLLSEGELMYGEDMEWCWRIRMAGWRIGVCGALRFQHAEGQSALRTWGETERRSRMWQGMYAACAGMYGVAYCRLLVATNALALAIEAYHPRRATDERDRARNHLRVHAAMLRGGIRPRVQRGNGAPASS